MACLQWIGWSFKHSELCVDSGPSTYVEDSKKSLPALRGEDETMEIVLPRPPMHRVK